MSKRAAETDNHDAERVPVKRARLGKKADEEGKDRRKDKSAPPAGGPRETHVYLWHEDVGGKRAWAVFNAPAKIAGPAHRALVETERAERDMGAERAVNTVYTVLQWMVMTPGYGDMARFVEKKALGHGLARVTKLVKCLKKTDCFYHDYWSFYDDDRSLSTRRVTRCDTLTIVPSSVAPFEDEDDDDDDELAYDSDDNGGADHTPRKVSHAYHWFCEEEQLDYWAVLGGPAAVVNLAHDMLAARLNSALSDTDFSDILAHLHSNAASHEDGEEPVHYGPTKKEPDGSRATLYKKLEDLGALSPKYWREFSAGDPETVEIRCNSCSLVY